ncbi:zf-HC2 domain-containing protein [Nocardiopsis sp. CC223A]|uniref:anti-sigma factor n=1 Tax=Nocardiopsis sp. CC223A TaxID=3044051 RepID=UPI00278BDD71|nr:zf-HC2 domain-containing protein [Nocardiopsis sp. CC223A]
MTSGTHDPQLLGAYVLGALDAEEAVALEAHLAGCEPCRAELRELAAVRDALGEPPPEAFLDGPPPAGSQALLRATVRRAGAERAVRRRRRTLRLALAAVLAGVVLAGAGGVAGRFLSPAAPQAEVTRLASGTVIAVQEDPGTGAAATVSLVPESAGLRLESFITGIPEGEECEVVVLTADGRVEVAAVWTVSAEAAAQGSRPGGVADVAPQDVASVVVRNTADTEFVTIDF